LLVNVFFYASEIDVSTRDILPSLR
jgi:hypothetical protein